MYVKESHSLDEYVRRQRMINSLHNNMREEQLLEEATVDAVKLCRFIKSINAPSSSFLDAGCRTGYCMDALADEFPSARIVGMDIVPEFVERASRRAGEAVLGDLRAMPFTDREFEWVLCHSTIEHTDDVVTAAREIQRVSSVGCYVITDIETDEGFNANPSHNTRCDNPMEWIDLFANEGWVLITSVCPTPGRIEMLWMRTEHFAAWRDRSNT